MRQPTLSQQLARLREDNLVQPRRDGKQIYYSLASEEVRRTIALLDELFCAGALAKSTPDAKAASKIAAGHVLEKVG